MDNCFDSTPAFWSLIQFSRSYVPRPDRSCEPPVVTVTQIKLLVFRTRCNVYRPFADTQSSHV